MYAAISVFEGMNEYEGEGGNGSGNNRIYRAIHDTFDHRYPCVFDQDYWGRAQMK